MPELIRDSSHGNQISVIYLEDLEIFRKISRNGKGRQLLQAEHKGIHWYAGRSVSKPNPLNSEIWDTDLFTRLDIEKVSGIHIDYNASLETIFPYVEKCLDHYLELWPRKVTVPCHGDLTLDNVIFTDDAPIFFDWEHFSPEGECWGFDIAYLFLSALLLPSLGKLPANTSERSYFINLWCRLRDVGLEERLYLDPVNYFSHAFNTGKHWESIVKNSPRKLFPLWISDDVSKDLKIMIQENS